MSSELKIKIGADVQQALSALNQFQKELKDTGNVSVATAQKVQASSEKVASGIASAGRGSGLGSAAIQQFKNNLLSSIDPMALLSTAVIAGGIALYEYATRVSFAERKQGELNKAIGEAVSKTAGERAELTSLVAVVGNAALGRKAQAAALKELQDKYPGYFSNVRLDANLTTNLQKATDKLTQSILLNAKAKAIQGEIEKSAQRVVDAGLEPQLSLLDQIKSVGAGLLGGPGTGAAAYNITSARLALNNYNQTVKEETALQKSLTEKLIEVNKQLAVKDAFDTKGSKPKTTNADTELNKQIASLNKQIAAIEQLQKLGLATGADINQLFKLRIQKVEIELPKTGFTPSQADRLKQLLEKQAADALRVNPFTIPLDTPKLTFDTSKALKSAVEAGKGMGLTLRKGLQDGIGKIDISVGVTDLIKEDLTNGLIDLASSLGDAISGAGLGAVLKSAENTIGGFLIDFGKLLIKSGISVEAIKKGIKSLALTPAASIAIGLASIAIGEIIRNASKGPSNKPRAFATGGIVTGPTNALIGEAGPEVVFPLDKLNRFLKDYGGGRNMQVQFSPVQSFISAQGIYQTWKAETIRRDRFR